MKLQEQKSLLSEDKQKIESDLKLIIEKKNKKISAMK